MKTCQNPLCNKTFEVTPGSLGKYCSLSCGTTHRNKILKQQKIEKYAANPICCTQCKIPLSYEKRKNKFCGPSCAASFNNARKDYTQIKVGPRKGTKPKNYAPYSRVKQCSICKKFHCNKGKTCSKQCRSQEISLRVRGKTGGNRDLNMPGVDCAGKKFFYESGWEVTLASSLSENHVYWVRPDRFILSDGRSYTPDFFLPDYGVYLDPKAKRPNYYRKSILKIDQFETEFNKKCLVISDKKLLAWYHIQTMLLLDVKRS